jgi:hypothetical protein
MNTSDNADNLFLASIAIITTIYVTFLIMRGMWRNFQRDLSKLNADRCAEDIAQPRDGAKLDLETGPLLMTASEMDIWYKDYCSDPEINKAHMAVMDAGVDGGERTSDAIETLEKAIEKHAADQPVSGFDATIQKSDTASLQARTDGYPWAGDFRWIYVKDNEPGVLEKHAKRLARIRANKF